jgi:hypothetical protein
MNKYFHQTGHNSTNKNKCIDRCKTKNSIVTHPITLTEHKDTINDVCSIYPEKNSMFSVCNDDKYLDKTSKTQLLDTLLIPISGFRNDNFLELFYDIHNLEQLLEYINAYSDMSYRTLARIYDIGIIKYKNEINVSDKLLYDLIEKIIMVNMKYIIKNTDGHYVIKDNYIDIEKNPKEKIILDTKNIKIITKYILKNILKMDKFIPKLITSSNDKNVSSIISYVSNYINKKLDNTLNI